MSQHTGLYRRFLIISLTCLASQGAISQESNNVADQVEVLNRTVLHLMGTYPDRFSKGTAFLQSIRDLGASPEAASVEAIREQVLKAHPALDGRSILFVERRQYPSDHHNTGNIFQTGEINVAKFKKIGCVKLQPD